MNDPFARQSGRRFPIKITYDSSSFTSGLHTSGPMESKGHFRRLPQIRIFRAIEHRIKQVPNFRDIVRQRVLHRSRNIRPKATGGRDAE